MSECIACRAPLAPALVLNGNTAATSDCHVVDEAIRVYRCSACGTLQKIADAAYLAAVGRIYDTYKSYFLSEGHEQIKFVGGVPRTRSDIILENIESYLPAGGSLLDIGTGSGVLLRAAHQRLGKRFELYGQDIQASSAEALADVPLKEFYVGDVARIERRFDMISMIHVLEHLADPLHVLKTARRLLKKGGVLLVQVPSVEDNVFDTIVFDHVFHFTKDTAVGLVERCGLKCVTPEKQLNNEITVIASEGGPARPAAARPAPVPDLSLVSRVTDYLLGIRAPMAVFGCAPTGTYCGALLKERLACFVDEAKALQFKRHLGKPILPPDRVEAGTPVFLPPNRNSRMIRERLKHLQFVSLDAIKAA